MFPLDFPSDILKREARRVGAGIVLDPFCGRGTTIFASRLAGRDTVGIDCNEVAIAATAAKLVSPNPDDIVREAELILGCFRDAGSPSGEFWELAYSTKVLEQVCALRAALLIDCTTPERLALRAIILGALHGPRRKEGSSYFSNQSPRTYAPKPRYAVKFWKTRALQPPAVDVLGLIADRARRFYSPRIPNVTGAAALADSRNKSEFAQAMAGRRAWLVVSSPPYYGLDTYRADQWLRSWFLGAAPNVDYSRGNQISHRSGEKFAEDLSLVWRNVADHALPDARLIIRFGGINERSHISPRDILTHSLARSPWRVRTIRHAGSAVSGRQQAQAFLKTKRTPVPEFDCYCALS
jgi:hypothetical protein